MMGAVGLAPLVNKKIYTYEYAQKNPLPNFSFSFSRPFPVALKKRATVQLPFSTQLPCILDILDLIILLRNLPRFTKSLWHLVNLLL